MDVPFQALIDRLDRLAQFDDLRRLIRKAVRLADDDPEMALTRFARVLEYVVHDAFERLVKEPPGTRPLENLLRRLVKDGHLPLHLAPTPRSSGAGQRRDASRRGPLQEARRERRTVPARRDPRLVLREGRGRTRRPPPHRPIRRPPPTDRRGRPECLSSRSAGPEEAGCPFRSRLRRGSAPGLSDRTASALLVVA